MVVHGLGDQRTLGWATLTFFIDALDARHKPVSLECRHDFHVLPAFAPGLCLGLDFITAHDVAISPARGRASTGAYTFEVAERIPGRYERETELRVTAPTVVPPGAQVWVPVGAMRLAPGVDYTAYPRLSVNEDETVRLVGPAACIRHRAETHLLVGNFGSAAFTLTRGTVVADACAAQLGDRVVPTATTFDLARADEAAPAVHAASPPVAEPEEPAAPVDAFEGTVDPSATLARDAVTTVVDDHFRVGVDAHGQPPAAVVETLRRHQGAFALDGRPGLVLGAEMGIELDPAVPLRPEAPRRASAEKRAAMDTAIDQLLDWGVIEPSASAVSFPVLMVRQYGKWRFCVDYRRLNDATVTDRYPLPTIDAVFQTLSGKCVFSSLDAIRGYHQLPVAVKDRWKTAFTCHRGLFQYRTVSFGLKNAPAVFQRLMDTLLGALRWTQAVVYIDDVVIASATMDEHVTALDQLLSNAEAIGLKFSPSKCTFAVPSLVLLGRKVSGAGVAVWTERAKAVAELKRPTTLRELYHVLGLFGYYRAFVPNYASVAEPLSRLTRGWRYERTDSGRTRLMNKAGEAVAADRVPVEWGPSQQSSFDDLKKAISSPPVLAHPDPSRPYLLYVDASKSAFAAALHQIGAAHDASPPPSRTAASMNVLAVHQLPPVIARERWRAWLRDDPLFAPVMARLDQSGTDPDWRMEDGLLVRVGDGRIALPRAGVPPLLRALHDENGHVGFFKTWLSVRQHFWRPGLSTSVREWVRHCEACQHTKLARKAGSLDISNDASLPFDAVSIDLVLGFPRSRSGNDAVLAIVDLFSRMTLLHPCTSAITAEGIVAIISERVLRLGWRPRRIVSDSEARMTGSVMQHLAASLGAEITPSPPHHQQANAVERTIQTAQRALQTLSLSSRAHWDQHALPAVELAINSTPSVVTQQRPFDLVFVSHPTVVHALLDGDRAGRAAPFEERLAAACERLEEARRCIATARAEQKRQYDGRRAVREPLQEGDRVFVRLPDRPVAGAVRDKLDARKMGPYVIEQVLSPHRVRLLLPADLPISAEFSSEQLDLLPRSADPFVADRPSLAPPPTRALPGGPASPVRPPASPTLSTPAPPRARRPPAALRDFHLGTASVDFEELLRHPLARPRDVDLGGRVVTLVERPVAFLSRLTSPSEQKLVAAELELCGLVWAFGRLAHLLEGALVTVVTDHAPMGAMLTSQAGVQYGPTISRCRAILMPHLHNLRFITKPGRFHNNVDALSRLTDGPGRSASLGGHVVDDGVSP